VLLDQICSSYDWYDHPEDHKFVQVYRNGYRACGHWLHQPGERSAFHRVRNTEELWLIHQGRLRVHLLSPDGAHEAFGLGTDLAAGERPVVTVPQGHRQAAEIPDGAPVALGSNVCAPAFSWDAFELADPEELRRAFPGHSGLILRLTREGDPPRREVYERNR
jgi:predicted cupin superfamily sugar epimerase